MDGQLSISRLPSRRSICQEYLKILNDCVTRYQRYGEECVQLLCIFAFQMESLLRNMAIDFKEASALYLVILQMVENKFVVTASHNCKNQPDLLFYSENDVAL